MNWFELCHEFIRKYHQQKIDEANIPRVYTKKQMAEDLVEVLAEDLVEVLRERDEARAACAAMREALHSALKIPRPWMDGGLTYTEWDEAFDKVEKAIDSPNPGAALLARIAELEKIARLAGDFIYPENMNGPWKEMNEALAAYQSVKGGVGEL